MYPVLLVPSEDVQITSVLAALSEDVFCTLICVVPPTTNSVALTTAPGSGVPDPKTPVCVAIGPELETIPPLPEYVRVLAVVWPSSRRGKIPGPKLDTVGMMPSYAVTIAVALTLLVRLTSCKVQNFALMPVTSIRATFDALTAVAFCT